MKNLLQFIADNWTTGIMISPFLYELVARLWPTKWNISILDNLWKVLNFVIPNVRKPDGTEVIPAAQTQIDFVPPAEKKALKKNGLLKNLVKVAVNRFVLKTVIILILAGSAHAQIWQTFKGTRYSMTNQNTGVSDTSSVLPIPCVYYNPFTQRLMGYDTAYFNLRQSGGGGGGTVTSVSGTANRITVTDPTTTPIINIASNYAGQNTITNVGTLTSGASGVGFNLNFTSSTKTGLIPVVNGGTNLSVLGSALQVLRVNSGATALEYATPFSVSLGAATRLPFMNAGGTDFSYNGELTYSPGNLMTTAPLLGLGIATTAGTIREISANGSSTNIGMILQPKGDGDFEVRAGSSAAIGLELGTAAHFYTANSFTSGTFSTFTFKTHDGSGATTPGYDLAIKTGNGTGPGAATSGSILIQPGIAFGTKPGNVVISGGINTSGDDSGDVYLSAASYTGDSATVVVRSDGAIRFRTHSEVVVEPNGLVSTGQLSLNNSRLYANLITGRATLVAGTATVTFDILPTDNVLLTVQTVGGTQGLLHVVPGVGTFDIVSDSATDTSEVAWFVVGSF